MLRRFLHASALLERRPYLTQATAQATARTTQLLHCTTMASPKPVNRVTMFKIAKAEDREALVQAYAKMQKESVKDGKPYILSISVGPALDEARSKGYTFVSQSRYASLDDMKYYDSEDPAHAELKSTLKGKIAEPPLVIFFEDALGGSK